MTHRNLKVTYIVSVTTIKHSECGPEIIHKSPKPNVKYNRQLNDSLTSTSPKKLPFQILYKHRVALI